MKTHVTKQPVLGELRQALAAVFFANPYFLSEEQLFPNHRFHEHEGAQQLTRWLRNTFAAIACRQPAGPFAASVAGHVV